MKKLIILLFVVIAGMAKAQPQLTVKSFNITTDTITSSTTTITLFDIYVANESITAFNDTLYLGFSVIDTAGAPQMMDTNFMGVIPIAAFDSTYFVSSTFTANTSLFKEGNNTVVIWPYTTNPDDVKDSLFYTFTYLGINELDNNELPVKLGPNPATESMFLGDPQNLVKHVRIRTLEGKFIRSIKTNTMVNLGDLINGIYIVEMETSTGIYTRKLIIQR